MKNVTKKIILLLSNDANGRSPLRSGAGPVRGWRNSNAKDQKLLAFCSRCPVATS